MHTSKTKLTATIVKNVFEECACWSVLTYLKWHLLTNLKTNPRVGEIIEFIKATEGVVFVYYHKDGEASFMLVGTTVAAQFNEKLSKFSDDQETNWIKILANLEKTNFETYNFNSSVLIWDVCYQQCVSTFIDCVSGGSVNGLPKNWRSIWTKNTGEQKYQQVQDEIDVGSNIFIDWCKQNNRSMEEGGFLKTFYIEFVEFFEKTHFKKP